MAEIEINSATIDKAMDVIACKHEDEEPCNNPTHELMQGIADAQMNSKSFADFTLQGCEQFFDKKANVIDLMRYAFTHGVMVGILLTAPKEPEVENGHKN